jgi:K+-sensing histidine kinase KdpD
VEDQRVTSLDGVVGTTGRRLAVTILTMAVATLALRAADAHLVVATSVYVVVVVLLSLLGGVAGGAAVAFSYLALNYYFTPRYHSFALTKTADIVPLTAFAIAAATCSTTVARVNSLRRKAETHERLAFEARVDAALNESRAGFLAAMTHNLRTPLASIKAAASTLRRVPEGLSADDRAGLVTTVHEEADRLERLVTKVLELSRIHGGALVPQRQPTDVAEVARSALHRIRQLADGRSLRLSVEGDVVEAEVDPQMMELVVVSLLENALRYAPGTSEVLISARPVDGECELRVTDHGPGIPVEDRERIFEEFVRLGAPVDGSGSGLGLAIARAFVEAQRGRIWVEPTPGGGATFVVRVEAVAA